MKLTDKACKSAVCPPDRACIRLFDQHRLYLEVRPSGSKLWRWKYRYGGKEKTMAIGSYPLVSLAAARSLRDDGRQKLKQGSDPMAERMAAKRRIAAGGEPTFGYVARKWYDSQVSSWSDGHAFRVQQLLNNYFGHISDIPVQELRSHELLRLLERIQTHDSTGAKRADLALETASRALMVLRQIWRAAVTLGYASTDVTIGLKDLLATPQKRHFGAITQPKQLGVLLVAIRAYAGSGLVVRSALQLAPLLFQRPGELRGATWAEIDLENAIWTIPPARMKRTKDGKLNGDPHLVPLSRQAIEILRRLKEIAGQNPLVFPGQRQHDRCISDNSVRTALISMGYGPELQTWHGFRATARTMLAEQMQCDPLVIEAQLAHAVKDGMGRAYNRTTYLAQRTEMMQRWADYLDQLAADALAQTDKPHSMPPESNGVIALASEEEYA